MVNANSLLKLASLFEKSAQTKDPSALARAEVRASYKQFKQKLIKDFDDKLQTLPDDQREAVESGETEVSVDVDAKKNANKFVVAVKISANPVTSDLRKAVAHMEAAIVIGDYMNKKNALAISAAATKAANKYSEEPAFAIVNDVLFIFAATNDV